MLKITDLSYSFPQKDLYNKISFTLEVGQHCAFIGTSGSGKSTLLDIIMDPENYLFDGKLEIDPESRIGYVSQFPKIDDNTESTVFDYVSEIFIDLQNKITTICTELETASDIEPLLEEYQVLLDTFQGIDGDNYESNITKKLNLANLNHLKDQRISKLSGGEFKLIQVIKEMLTNPELLIMDEPDVFLDFENIISLKSLINSHKNTLLVITHSRFLLNHCFNKIIHLENMELQAFDGGYMAYNISLLETKIELQELAIADDEEIARNEAMIEKLREKATYNAESANGRSLKARVKIQERLLERRIKSPFVDIKQPHIQLSTTDNTEDSTALKVNDYSLAFDEILLENVDFELKPTDKVAIVGANGTGKTTLLREIFKNNNNAIEVNETTDMAYLSQIQGEMLNESNTILDEFMDMNFETYSDAKAYLENYNIEGDVINQKISSLSGGEKNILQIAKIALSNANMLLLDEPTSHLDTYTRIALENAIKDYNGAVLMISHDYYTIVNSMDYVLLIENKTIRKVKMKKFKRMIYAKHFDRNYLDLEEKKNSIERNIEFALHNKNFVDAKILWDELDALIQ